MGLSSRVSFLVALVLIATLSTTAVLHSVIPHIHPDESAHRHGSSSGNEDQTAYVPMATHGHEEKLFFGLVAAVFLVVIFNIDQLRARMAQGALARERHGVSRRRPPYLVLLFAKGILNPRIP